MAPVLQGPVTFDLNGRELCADLTVGHDLNTCKASHKGRLMLVVHNYLNITQARQWFPSGFVCPQQPGSSSLLPAADKCQ